MTSSIVIGSAPGGADIRLDIEELLATRLLVQGNSGSGKSHLLRRILEQSAGLVQQVVIDPEGDFVSLSERFGHTVIDGSAYSGSEIAHLAARVRKHRVSVVLALDALEVEAQMRCASQFLSALFEAPRDEWYPALVVVDEAQLFAPAAAGEVSDEVRRLSLGAMTNLMCRGRKRGLAGAIATQRLAKLAKNVAAEASNFLMGRTFLDIDMARAADLLGMERRQAEQIRDLERGHFLALGPAISRRPLAVRIGAVESASSSASHGLLPLPGTLPEDVQGLLHSEWLEEEIRERQSEPSPIGADALIEQIARQDIARDSAPKKAPANAKLPTEIEAMISEILLDMAAEDGSTFRSAAVLYQDFSVRCRMQRIPADYLDLTVFRRRFALAVGGVADPSADERAEIVRAASPVPDDLLAPFLILATAAKDGSPCPTDEMLARAYGTNSPGRIRRMLEHLEKSGLIVVKTDFSGRRSVGIPDLGSTTAPSQQ